MKTLIIAALLAATPCREVNLAHFYSKGQEVKAEVVGKDDPCDDFGGAGMDTPKYHVTVYVNFNIPARLNIDVVDQALDNLSPEAREFFLRVTSIAVVKQAWMDKHFAPGTLASLNWMGNFLFVSEAVVAKPGGWETLIKDFYAVEN